MQRTQRPNQSTNPPPPYLTVREAAAEMALSPHTIRSWLAQGRLGYLRLGRAIRVPRSEVDRLLAAATVHPSANRRKVLDAA